MKRFYLQRNQDASGVSGLGRVAEGCQFDTGWCALVWLTKASSMCYYPNIEVLEEIHGHQGMTKIIWVDDESSNVCIKLEPSKDEPCDTCGGVDCPGASRFNGICPKQIPRMSFMSGNIEAALSRTRAKRRK